MVQDGVAKGQKQQQVTGAPFYSPLIFAAVEVCFYDAAFSRSCLTLENITA